MRPISRISGSPASHASPNKRKRVDRNLVWSLMRFTDEQEDPPESRGADGR